MFKIGKVEIKKEVLPQCKGAQCGILPEHPFRSFIVGSSGSGKTNYLLSILTRWYKDYFDKIYVFSMTQKRT